MQGGSNDEDICRTMHCYDPNKQNCSVGVEDRAYNGTSCGPNKWCINGECVYHPDAPHVQGKADFFVTNVTIYLGLLLKLPLVAPEHLGFLSQG